MFRTSAAPVVLLFLCIVLAAKDTFGEESVTSKSLADLLKSKEEFNFLGPQPVPVIEGPLVIQTNRKWALDALYGHKKWRNPEDKDSVTCICKEVTAESQEAKDDGGGAVKAAEGGEASQKGPVLIRTETIAVGSRSRLDCISLLFSFFAFLILAG